jgi:serine/threonine protein kinase
MAPEQAEGRNLEIGPATDIYALGAILYEMLTGRPPFLGKDTKETLDKVIHEPLVPPRQLQPGVPGELEEICLRCLAKKPADRFPSATTLARDLQLFLDLKNLGWGVFGPRELLRSPGCSWGGGANPGPALWGKGLARDGRPSAT